LAEEVGADKIKMCKYFKVDAFASLPANKLDQAKNMLEKKRKPS